MTTSTNIGNGDHEYTSDPFRHAERFLGFLGSVSSTPFQPTFVALNNTGGVHAVPGASYQCKGSLSDNWSRLKQWEGEAYGSGLYIEPYTKVIWLRGQHETLSRLQIEPSVLVQSGSNSIDIYWLVSDIWAHDRQWREFREAMHEALVRRGGDSGSTHMEGLIVLPGTEFYQPEGAFSAQIVEPWGAEPRPYSMNELLRAFEIDPKTIWSPPIKGKVAETLAALDERLGKGGEEADKIPISELIKAIGGYDRKNFRKDIITHPSFMSAIAERSYVYISSVGGRGNESYITRKGGEVLEEADEVVSGWGEQASGKGGEDFPY